MVSSPCDFYKQQISLGRMHAGIQELLHTSLFASGISLAVHVSVTELTTDPRGAKAAEEIMPGVTFAAMAPDVAPPEQLAGS